MQEISSVDPNAFLPLPQNVISHGFNPRSFVVVLADIYETPVSCARSIIDFLGECSRLASISSSLFSLSYPSFD
jgi:hypothetical protein